MREKIIKRLEEHCQAINSNNYDILGVFLYGSQNYGLEFKGDLI